MHDKTTPEHAEEVAALYVEFAIGNRQVDECVATLVSDQVAQVSAVLVGEVILARSVQSHERIEVRTCLATLVAQHSVLVNVHGVLCVGRQTANGANNAHASLVELLEGQSAVGFAASARFGRFEAHKRLAPAQLFDATLVVRTAHLRRALLDETQPTANFATSIQRVRIEAHVNAIGQVGVRERAATLGSDEMTRAIVDFRASLFQRIASVALF